MLAHSSLAFVLALTLVGCKQPSNLRMERSSASKQDRTGQSFQLAASNQTTGQLGLAALYTDQQKQFDALALVECNSVQIEAANSAIQALIQFGARRQSGDRQLEVATTEAEGAEQRLSGDVRCQLVHPEAVVDAQSLTLINERIRGYSSFRTPTRSDLAIYEIAQLAWVGMSQALASMSGRISEAFVDEQALISRQIMSSSFGSQLARSAELYDPCMTSTSKSLPRWMILDPELRVRQFSCASDFIALKYDEQRTYPAVRHSLRSALVGLYRDARGMRPSFVNASESQLSSVLNRFVLIPLIHDIPVN